MAFVEQVCGLCATSTTGELVITTPAQTRCLGEDLVSRHTAASSGERRGGKGFCSNIHNLFKKFAGVRIFIEGKELRNRIQSVR